MASKVFMSLAVLALVFLYNGCLGYPNGAPERACFSMTPSHGVSAQPTNSSPFAIDVNAVYYKPGKPIQITIYSKGGSNNFKGLLVQARQIGNYANAIGSFQNLPSGTQYVNGCQAKSNATKDAVVTHTKVLNLSNITLEWLPPDDVAALGNISFYATVVKEKEVFWVKIPSLALMPRNASSPTGEPSNCGGLASGFSLMLLFVTPAIGWFMSISSSSLQL